MRNTISAVALGILGTIVVLIVLGALSWPNDWWPLDPDYSRAATIQHFDRVRGFNPNRGPVCAVEKTREGDALTITLNRGRSCRRTFDVTISRMRVNITRGGKHARAHFVYNRRVLFHDYATDGLLDWRSPNSGGKEESVKRLTSMSLGQMVTVDLRSINLRLPAAFTISSASSA